MTIFAVPWTWTELFRVESGNVAEVRETSTTIWKILYEIFAFS